MSISDVTFENVLNKQDDLWWTIGKPQSPSDLKCVKKFLSGDTFNFRLKKLQKRWRGLCLGEKSSMSQERHLMDVRRTYDT